MEKKALGFDLHKVLADPALTEHARRALQRGTQLVEGAGIAGRAAKSVARAAGHGLDALLAPAARVGPPILRGAQALGQRVVQSPTATKALVGGAVLAPILGSAFMGRQQREENTVMQARQNPERDVTASLDTFLEKRAARSSATSYLSSSKTTSYAGDVIHGLQTSGRGIGGDLAKGFAVAAGHGIAGLAGAAIDLGKDLLVTQPRRRQVFESVLRQDQVIADFIRRGEENLALLTDAYATLCRFAPSLATDANVVRSYLREVALGGGGVNYVTVKSLIETEKSLADARRKGVAK